MREFTSSNLLSVIIMVKNIVTKPKYRYNNVAFSTPINKAIRFTYSALSKLINPNIEPTIRNNLAKILEKGLNKP
mgnify:FL=1